MYISENYLCFYSFMLGMETKIFLELKDIGDLQKEKSKRGVFADAIRVVMKDEQEVGMIIRWGCFTKHPAMTCHGQRLKASPLLP